MKLNLHHYEKQLIKYTKGHFERDLDYKNDIKYFAARLYGLPIEHTPVYSVANMVIDIYQQLVDAGYLENNLKRMFDTLFKRARWDNNKDNINYDDVIWYYLSCFQGLQIKGYDDPSWNIDLGETDESIFNEVA